MSTLSDKDRKGEVEKAEKESRPPSRSIASSLLVAIGLSACCGLPILLLAGGSLILFPLFSGTNLLLFVTTVLIFLASSFFVTVWNKKRKQSVGTRKGRDECCQ